MIVFELVGRKESHPDYQELEASNTSRQLGFLESSINSAIRLKQPFLSQTVIRALNYHSIACLHPYAGQYRPHDVHVGDGVDRFDAPEHYRVPTLMDDFVNQINRLGQDWDPVKLAAQVLWRLNWIHPFVNGNGRTARAACYYALCLKAGTLFPGTEILPALLKKNRAEYVAALKQSDQGAYKELEELIARLLLEQLASAGIHPPNS